MANAPKIATDEFVRGWNEALAAVNAYCLVWAERGRGPLAPQLRQICTMQCETIMEEIDRLALKPMHDQQRDAK